MVIFVKGYSTWKQYFLIILALVFSVTSCSRSDTGQWVSESISQWALALTFRMWPWWVMIPEEDFTDVTMAIKSYLSIKSYLAISSYLAIKSYKI